ncbi:MAG: DUF4185 domain-containing protein [Candidatus Eisenbacteria bacterium]|nr:DUF4185 domain-containing protein [Candidatus Eisenbacteria bacterium]
MRSVVVKIASLPLGWIGLFALTGGCGGDDLLPDYSQPPSPVIDSIYTIGTPVRPFYSNGDLWMNTWADDGNLYSAWGDGRGVRQDAGFTDCGIARFAGDLPTIESQEQRQEAPTTLPKVDDKPSSLIFVDGKLIGQFHSPLRNPWIGYLAYSEDYGRSWTRLGFYEEGASAPPDASPWTRDRGSPFRCLFFINMGRNYELNEDGFVYALGIGREWTWSGGLRLARVRREQILDYEAYEYLAGYARYQPQWSTHQSDAIVMRGIWTTDQGSAMYHPGIGRYLFLNARDLFEAPFPWGPWTHAGSWVEAAPEEWQGGYQPGIVTKGATENSFWFTISGQNALPRIIYRLNLGRIGMVTKADVPEE